MTGLLPLTALGSSFLAMLADRRYRQLSVLPVAGVPSPLPSLSVIVPARNEAENLKRLLPSLSASSYPGELEIIVVDDQSSDETADVARVHGARVLSLSTLPTGWLGKPFACHQGVQIARGQWLLFTDADTVHTSHGLASAVAYARRQGLDGLSLFLKQRTTSRFEALVLSVAFAALLAGMPPAKPILNGQYILLRRSTYERSAGFAAVRHEAVEDLALGQHLRVRGYNVPLMLGEEAAAVQMYSSFSHLWRGLIRLGGGSLRWAGSGSLLVALSITFALMPLLALAIALAKGQGRKRAAGAWVIGIYGFRPWSKRFEVGRFVFLTPIAAALMQVAATFGLAMRIAGRGVPWKGRTV